MDYALVFKWLKPSAGREAKALEVLADFRTYWGKLFADSKIEEPILLTHTNDGMMIIRGEMMFLFETINTDEFILLLNRAMFIADGFEFHGYFMADAADHRLGLYAQAGKELAYL